MTSPRPVFLPGVFGGSSCWESMIRRFDGAALLGLPGRPGPDPVVDAGELVGWVALAIARLPGPRVLVGHGLGALAALEAARSHPEAIQGVVALGCAAQLSVPDLSGLDANDAIAALLASSMREPEASVGKTFARVMHEVGPTTLHAALEMCRTLDILETAHAVRCPVLIVVGGNDTWAPPDRAATLARHLPMSHLVVVTGSQHLVHVDAPATTQLLIAAFLARLELTLADQ